MANGHPISRWRAWSASPAQKSPRAGPIMPLRSNRIIPCRISQSAALIMIAECIRLHCAAGCGQGAVRRGGGGTRKRRQRQGGSYRGEESVRCCMIIIELSERRLMTLVTLPMAARKHQRNRDLTCNTATGEMMHFTLAISPPRRSD